MELDTLIIFPNKRKKMKQNNDVNAFPPPV